MAFVMEARSPLKRFPPPAVGIEPGTARTAVGMR